MNHQLDMNNFESLSALNKAQGQMMTVLPFLTGPLIHHFPKNKEAYFYHCLDQERGKIPIFGDLYVCQMQPVFNSKKSIFSRSEKLRIILHGISSTPKSPYLAPYVHAALKSGHDVLCLALRGALSKGHDHYHAGLTDDLFAVLKDPRLKHYKEVTILGCSLGGLLALNVARQCQDDYPKLKGVASICPPICMQEAQVHLDRPQQRIYRRFVLTSLKLAYYKIWQQANHHNKPFKSKFWKVMRVKTFADWDKEVVLPRFGFSSIADYYQKVSINSADLNHLKLDSLLIFDRADPMVPIAKMGLEDREYKEYGKSSVYITKGGGHIGFPFNLDLGLGEKKGIAKQVEFWFSQLSH